MLTKNVLPVPSAASRNFTTLLHTNMRVNLCGDLVAGTFADQLLAIGDVKFPIITVMQMQWIPLYTEVS